MTTGGSSPRVTRWMSYVDRTLDINRTLLDRKTKVLDYFILVPLILAMVLVSVAFDTYVQLTVKEVEQ